MTSTDTAVEITRENAYDVHDALNAEQRQLRTELDATTDPAQRAAIYRRAATNQERQALAWERRPGRTRDKQGPVAQYRAGAQLLTTAADIEQLRAHAAERGRELPDPMPLLQHLDLRVYGGDAAVQTVLALYTAAADMA